MKSYYFILALGVCFLTSAQGQAAAVNVKCEKGKTIQAAVDGAVDGDTITVSGTCTEIVTVTTNGITFIGDPGVGGTLNGGFIVDGAQRVVFDNLTIDGSTNTGRVDGVLAENNAHVTVRNSTIENHTRSAVNIRSTSSALVEGNTIGNNTNYGVLVDLGSFALLRGTAENPAQTITSSADFGCCSNAVGVFNNSHARLNGGNVIEGTGFSPAIALSSLSHVRLQNGSNIVTSTKDRAIDATKNSVLSLRWFDVTGRIGLFTGSNAEIRKRLNFEPDPMNPPTIAGVINGNIRVRSGAHVRFHPPFLAPNGITRQGSVTVNGRLDCGGDRGHVVFGTAFGQTLQVVFPSQFNRENSQCNDFNANGVLPVFGP